MVPTKSKKTKTIRPKKSKTQPRLRGKSLVGVCPNSGFQQGSARRIGIGRSGTVPRSRSRWFSPVRLLGKPGSNYLNHQPSKPQTPGFPQSDDPSRFERLAKLKGITEQRIAAVEMTGPCIIGPFKAALASSRLRYRRTVHPFCIGRITKSRCQKSDLKTGRQ